MSGNHVTIGILAVVATVVWLGVRYSRAPKRARLPARGWVGLAAILAAELLLCMKTPVVTVFFTPIAWTGYLLLVDGLVESLRGDSRWSRAPGAFLALAFWSVPLWLIFEAYNLRLANWGYAGLPQSLLVRALGYAWSFATIWPAIFETADLLEALGLFAPQGKRRLVFSARGRAVLFLVGLVFLAVPVSVPVRLGQYLFGLVWVGFVLLLDPISYRWHGRSLLREWEEGRTGTSYRYLLAGMVCGLLWEFWNFWAAARWVYVFPIMRAWKIFEMPAPGYLGFPVFALECLVMYEFLRCLRLRWQAGGRLGG
jgi:hypothetical protein